MISRIFSSDQAAAKFFDTVLYVMAGWLFDAADQKTGVPVAAMILILRYT